MWEEYRDKANHLRIDEQEEMAREYYEGTVSNKDLANKYGISGISPIMFYKILPIICSDNTCKYCSEHMYQLPTSRTSSNRKTFYCQTCGHLEYNYAGKQCVCDMCIEEQQRLAFEEEQEKLNKTENCMKKIEEMYSNHLVKCQTINDLSVKNVIILGAFLHGHMENEYRFTEPIDDRKIKFSPLDHWSDELIIGLNNDGLIAVSEESPIDAFPEDEDFPRRYYINRVKYYPSLDPSNSEDQRNLITGELDDYFSELSDEGFEECILDIVDFWKEVGIREGIEYLLFQLNGVGLWFNPGIKTYDTFSFLMNNFSISEVYSIVYAAITLTCRVRKEKGLTAKHAANTSISIISRNADKILAGEWERRSFNNRPKNPDQSDLSYYFFYRALGIGEEGFAKKPDVEYVRNKLRLKYRYDI